MEEGGSASTQDLCTVLRKTRFSGDTGQGQPSRGSVGRAVLPEGPVSPGAGLCAEGVAPDTHGPGLSWAR